MLKIMTIGKVSAIVPNPAPQPTIGYHASLLAAIRNLVNDEVWLPDLSDAYQKPVPAATRLACRIRGRVAEKLEQQLKEIERAQNKKCGRRYVHWSNSMGRYFDEGE